MDLHPDAIRPRELLAELEARARSRPDVVRVDLSKVDDIDAAGVATLRVADRRLARAGIRLELSGASPEFLRMLDETPEVEAPEHPKPPGLFARVGEFALTAWHGSLALADMAIEATLGVFAAMLGRRTFTVRDVLDQFERIAVDSTGIVTLLSFVLGLVLAFQTWVQLHAYGTEQLVLEFVGIGMARGFAPFILAVLVSGRTGSAIAAELSTMEMRQENDALRVMGISPVRHLVAPRLIALTLAMPSVNLLATAAGIVGGLSVTMVVNRDWMAGVDRLLVNLELGDLWLGAVKSVLFGWVIGFASAFAGFHSGFGPISIGTAATRSVVACIFFIMIVDGIVTTIWTIAQ